MSDVEKKSASPEKRGAKSPASQNSSRDRSRKRRSRSRERRRRSRSRSKRSRSPLVNSYRAGNFRSRDRFNRRSPDRRFRRSPDRRFRRFDRRRSRSKSPDQTNANYMQQQQMQPMVYTDAYGNYIPSAPTAPQFGGMTQYNAYDFQAQPAYPPPAPSFGGISCPAPPGMNEGWAAPQVVQQEESEEEKQRKEAAIAEEKKRQREDLKKQREQYTSRTEKMKRELKELKKQKADLVAGHGKRSPSPKTDGFIKENEKLQSQISSKLSEFLSIIDMLSTIIKKDEDEPQKKKPSRKAKNSDSDSSPERIKTELLESMRKKKEAEGKKQKFNYIVYDPELHWCKQCQVFPKTAKDFLVHLHSKEHADKNSKNPAPWRENFQKTNEVPLHPDAPTKRAPIRGLQFFEPATAWYCKLCEIFMGDTFCASLHLKSELHTEKYDKLLEKEPKFEDRWLEARRRAHELSEPNGKASQDKKEEKKSKKKSKKREKKKKSEKKRKRGSSSSSSSSSSEGSGSSSESENNKASQEDSAKNSIRVTMRNMLSRPSDPADERAGKWTMVNNEPKPIPPPAPSISQNAEQEKKKEEQVLGQWSKVEPIISQEEKKLLESLKGKLKSQKKVEEAEKPKGNDRIYRSKKSMSRSSTRSKRSVSRSKRSRSLSRPRRSRSRPKKSRLSRSRSRGARMRRSRSRTSRSRRSRTRSRSRSRGRFARRSRSRSRSRDRRRGGRPIVQFPTEPRLPPPKEEKKLPARSYVQAKKEDPYLNSKKPLPMIGKMPAVKKQLNEKKTEEVFGPKEPPIEPVPEPKHPTKKPRDDTFDDMMPDPLQYSALMGAPPPPPRREEPEAVVPPGLDPDFDSEFIPKPISDAPIARKGPLPRDFQETLDILFDGETPKPMPKPTAAEPVADPIPVEPPPMVMSEHDGPQMMMADELSQHALLYGGFYVQNADGSDPIEANKVEQAADTKAETSGKSKEENGVAADEVETEGLKDQMMDLDDLAMLGIDPNDVGSGFW